MGYVKVDWDTGMTISKGRLNQMDNGIFENYTDINSLEGVVNGILSDEKIGIEYNGNNNIRKIGDKTFVVYSTYNATTDTGNLQEVLSKFGFSCKGNKVYLVRGNNVGGDWDFLINNDIYCDEDITIFGNGVKINGSLKIWLHNGCRVFNLYNSGDLNIGDSGSQYGNVSRVLIKDCRFASSDVYVNDKLWILNNECSSIKIMKLVEGIIKNNLLGSIDVSGDVEDSVFISNKFAVMDYSGPGELIRVIMSDNIGNLIKINGITCKIVNNRLLAITVKGNFNMANSNIVAGATTTSNIIIESGSNKNIVVGNLIENALNDSGSNTLKESNLIGIP